jgi:tRNA(Ile)-lysidine synthase
VSVAGVAHFNHKLRGPSSDADEEFVRAMAHRHGLPFYLGEALLAAGNLEQEARRARQRFFRRLMCEGHADAVAVGHTQDDQAETVLLRLMRGSGTSGLAGILPVTREGLIRPLLAHSRDDVLDYLRSRNISWREDGSNDNLEFRRNRVRHDLLPRMASSFNPRIVETLAQTAEIAQDEEAWWSAEMVRLSEKLLQAGDQSVEVNARDLSALPAAVGRRLIRQAIRLAKGDLRKIEFQHIDQVRKLAASPDGGKSARLPGLWVQRSLDWLRLSPGLPPVPGPVFPVTLPGYYCFDQSWVSVEVIEKTGAVSLPNGPNPYGTLKLDLCWDLITNPFELQGGPEWRGRLELRAWRSGDSYWPEGRSRSYQISELFQDARIPSWRRRSWPILSYRPDNRSSEILWVKGFGAAKGWGAGDASSGLVLRIREKDESFRYGLASE